MYPFSHCRDRRPRLSVREIELTKYGQIADKYIKQLKNFYNNLSVEEYVIMPNHIHLLLWVKENKNSTKRWARAKPIPLVGRCLGAAVTKASI